MRVGLTGNFGMGKSTVAAMFRELGALTISTDAIVARLLTEPDIVGKVRDLFGTAVVREGRIDRKRLSEVVFSNPSLRIALEDFLHPRVFSEVDDEIRRYGEANASVPVIIEAPVLFERGYQNRFDRIIMVFTSDEVAVRRLKLRGVSEAEAMSRLRSQLPIEKKKAGSDYLIDNSGTENETREQVMRIHDDLVRMVRSSGHN